MNGDMFFEVVTLGGMTEDRAPDAVGAEVPHGCEWFMDCGRCRWDDCTVDEPLDHDSDEAKVARGRAFVRMMAAGLRGDEIAEFFGMAVVAVELESMLGRTRATGEKAKTNAIMLRKTGVSERTVASTLGVSTRQVRYWCAGVEGIERGRGNQHRGEDGSCAQVVLHVVSADDMVAVVARHINQRNPDALCQVKTGAVDKLEQVF